MPSKAPGGLAAGALADPSARWGARSTAMAGLPRL